LISVNDRKLKAKRKSKINTRTC